MITALIRADGRIEPLAATLAALVPAVAEGLVADAVVIAATHGSRRSAAVAEAVGAAHVVFAVDGEAWAAGAALARREWLLCLEAGDVPAAGWIRALERFVAFAGEPRIGRLSGPCGGSMPPRSSRPSSARAARRRGLVVHRTLLDRSGLSARLRPAIGPARAPASPVSPMRPRSVRSAAAHERALPPHPAPTPGDGGDRRMTVLAAPASASAAAPRLRCSSRRGMISTKLQGRWR